jgi:transmembrane sensor
MSNEEHISGQGTPPEQLRTDAAAWLAKLDRGLADHELVELIAWIDGSAANRKMLFKAAALWDDLGVLNELSVMFPLAQAPRQQKRANLGFAGAIAATALVAVIGWFNLVPERNQQLLEYDASLHTQIGEHKTESLPDGSSILLNTQTQIEILYSSESRLITLKSGEAHFDVSHDPQRPFIVKAGNSYFRAIGTAFNIHVAQDNHLELLVREGVVSVHKGTSSDNNQASNPLVVTDEQDLKVGAGQKMLIETDAASRIEKVELATMQAELAWQQGMLVFQGEPLHEALVEVSRYNAVDFRIDDASIAAIHVAGYYKAGDIDGLLASLEDNFGIRSRRSDGNQIVLTGPSE